MKRGGKGHGRGPTKKDDGGVHAAQVLAGSRARFTRDELGKIVARAVDDVHVRIAPVHFARGFEKGRRWGVLLGLLLGVLLGAAAGAASALWGWLA